MTNFHEADLELLRKNFVSGTWSSQDVVEALLTRIEALDRQGPQLRSIIEVNPRAMDIAVQVGAGQNQTNRPPLQGIPILLKDNIDTDDEMLTTAGSLALTGSRPRQDAFVARRLRDAGAILIGKANMSEWANFRSTHSSSGWSARGGQAKNPYALDRSPCGSSSGSAIAVAAGLVPVAIGTETDGSILCPAAFNGVVGIKPTVGLTSRAGVIPISHTQDTVGPFARTVADAATVLTLIAGEDPRDAATTGTKRWPALDYTRFLNPSALKGARVGVAREVYFGYSHKADRVVEDALAVIRDAGAELIDPADIPTAKAMKEEDSELEVLLYEFKADLNAYLATRPPGSPRNLEAIIQFNIDQSKEELPFFGQEIMYMAQEKGSLTEEAYVSALSQNRRLSREEGIDAVMQKHRLDALVMPTAAPAFPIDLINGDHYGGGSSQPMAMAGYPAITLPAGDVSGLPVGITFAGNAFSEPALIGFAHAFERAVDFKYHPRFLPTLEL